MKEGMVHGTHEHLQVLTDGQNYLISEQLRLHQRGRDGSILGSTLIFRPVPLGSYEQISALPLMDAINKRHTTALALLLNLSGKAPCTKLNFFYFTFIPVGHCLF